MRSKRYIDIFISMMRKKCLDLGLNNTNIECPCGLSYENKSSAFDVLKILLEATQYRDICKYWCKKTHEIEICRDSLILNFSLDSTVYVTSYGDYKIVGGKTGSDGFYFNLAAIFTVKSEFFACVVLNAKSEIDRKNAIISLLNFATKKESPAKIENIASAIVCKIQPSVFPFYEQSVEILYEQESNVSIPILSITKLVTAMVLLDSGIDLQNVVKISRFDLQRGSGAFLRDNDVITYSDALVAMLLPSSNTASYVVARNVGGIKYKNQKKKKKVTLKGCFRKVSHLSSFSFYESQYDKFIINHNWPCLVWEKTKLRYKNTVGRELDYKHVQNLNEKLMWLTRYWQHPIKTTCADKYLVRNFIKEKGLENLLVPLLGVWNTVDQIDFENLPKQFVLKCNHGCNYNIICLDKSSLNVELTKQKLKKWLNEDFYLIGQEIHYKNIPRKIICEKLLDKETAPLEYQVWCVNGKADSILVCRKNWNGTYDSWSYSLDWVRLYDRVKETESDCPKPKSLDEIVSYSEVLSENIPFVRMDFYEVNGNVYFAEMTFTPAMNILTSYKSSFVNRLGEKLILPKKYR